MCSKREFLKTTYYIVFFCGCATSPLLDSLLSVANKTLQAGRVGPTLTVVVVIMNSLKSPLTFAIKSAAQRYQEHAFLDGQMISKQ